MSNDSPDFSKRDVLDGVNKLFSQRWSPRSYASTLISDNDLQIIFEAARWSPSCYNEQPWQFITSTQASHDTFVDLLVDGNQRWAKLAPVIGFVVAAKIFTHNGNNNAHAEFDCGAAWMGLSLQANMLGIYAHGMGGIHYQKVYETLSIDSKTHQVICGFTLGYLDESGEEKLTKRKPLEEIWLRYP